jgi:hypothetical protein
MEQANSSFVKRPGVYTAETVVGQRGNKKTANIVSSKLTEISIVNELSIMEPRETIPGKTTCGEVRVKTQRNAFTIKYGPTLWQNPNRTCPKIAKFYNNREASFNQHNLNQG